MSKSLDMFEQRRLDALNKYNRIFPEVIFSNGMSAIKIDLAANVAKLLLDVDRPKAFVMVNINNPNNTPVFIGANRNVTFESGFPVVAGSPIRFGVSENTEIWGIAAAVMTIYILDMGL